MSSKIKICIVSSLVVNVLLIGIVGGHLLKVAGRETSPPLRIAYNLQKLSSGKNIIIDKMLHELNEQNEAVLGRVKSYRQEIYKILTSNEFDSEAYLASSAKLNRTQGELIDNISDKIGEVAGQLTKDDRIILAELLKEPPSMPHRAD